MLCASKIMPMILHLVNIDDTLDLGIICQFPYVAVRDDVSYVINVDNKKNWIQHSTLWNNTID